MKNTTSSSLLHFTKKMSTLKSIISNGIRFSFSAESFPAKMVKYEMFGNIPINIRDNKEIYKVGIPMICFYDIPILRAQTHAKKYGNYVIGLDKEYIRDLYSPILNPVIYCNSENLINMISRLYFMKNKVLNQFLVNSNTASNQKEFTKDHEKFLESKSQEMKNIASFKADISFLAGLFKYYNNPEKTDEIYYDEREWRAFWPNKLSDKTDWIWNMDNLSKKDIKIYNQEIEKSDSGYIKLNSQEINLAITHIIVNKEKETEQMIQHIMSSKKIFDCNTTKLSEIEKLMLIRKITSFERINRDY